MEKMMKNKRYKQLSVLVLLFLPTFVSCKQSNVPEDLPSLTPCVVTLTQENEPLEGATIVLTAVSGNQKWYAGGLTGPDGSTSLSTNGRYAGAPSGKFKVVVTKILGEPSKLPPRPAEGDPGFAEWMTMSAKEKPVSYSFVEETYTQPNSTPHEVEIAGRKKLSFSFDVGKKVKIKQQ